jgi:hypothetical protein
VKVELITGKAKEMLFNISENSKLVMSEEAEIGSAGEQPIRNNLANWNSCGVGIFPTSINQIIPVMYALKNSSLLHFILRPFVRFKLKQYKI